ncbi:MAG: PIN domain-containing protein [Clostridiales bacterium]|jgi:predicted nucleic acid-binding protein|nr:PIN domain-containing protein [Clostridiales bacterium]
MTVLLDTNIIMDALQERQPFDVAAKNILRRSQIGELACLFTANTATDIFFLYRRARDLKSAQAALWYLLTNYGVVSVTQEDCINAMSTGIDDFEDALVMVCAEKAKADYIVTRDEEFLHSSSSVPLISPEVFLEKLNEPNAQCRRSPKR